jgi:adenosylhomocysteine nucleosidase
VDSALSPTLACALEVEERIARAGGARAARVGLGARLPLPEGRLVSFGVCGALVPGLEPGALLTAQKVVGPDGAVLWEGDPIEVPGALRAIICTSEVANEPEERRMLAEGSGAVAVDTESGILASSGRLVGVVRAVSDAAEEPVGRLVCAAKADGGTDWSVVARAFLLEPIRSLRTALAARRAFASLRQAASALAQEPVHG